MGIQFEENNEGTTRTLTGTATLVREATSIAKEILAALNENAEELTELFLASKEHNGKMDELIGMFHTFTKEESQFILENDEQTVASMLRSQQSKRARLKKKPQTKEIYCQMMVAAVAENMIRVAADMPKGRSFIANTINLNLKDEEIDALALDQEELRRVIRNIQSLKSIEKRKEDFTEDGERYISLCNLLDRLKAVRTTSARTKRVDKTTAKLQKMLDGRDPESFTKKQLTEMLAAALDDTQEIIEEESEAIEDDAYDENDLADTE